MLAREAWTFNDYREQLLAVAWLHDVLEDCPWMAPDRLTAAGVAPEVVGPVLTLTHRPSESYADYIGFIASGLNPMARTVKLADLHDHLRPGYTEVLSQRSIDTYRAALVVLEGR